MGMLCPIICGRLRNAPRALTFAAPKSIKAYPGLSPAELGICRSSTNQKLPQRKGITRASSARGHHRKRASFARSYGCMGQLAACWVHSCIRAPAVSMVPIALCQVGQHRSVCSDPASGGDHGRSWLYRQQHHPSAAPSCTPLPAVRLRPEHGPA